MPQWENPSFQSEFKVKKLNIREIGSTYQHEVLANQPAKTVNTTSEQLRDQDDVIKNVENIQKFIG